MAMNFAANRGKLSSATGTQGGVRMKNKEVRCSMGEYEIEQFLDEA